ncbi:MAG: DNA photolyase [Candidatus Margulisbacteria bacterium]|nr:DNA photolyase [Candidatus Margulisiibacteriota bacterium]
MAIIRPEIIYIEKEIAELPYTRVILQKFSGIPAQIIGDLRALIQKNKKPFFTKTGQPLVLAKQRGRFLRKCPGTKEHICCNYYTLNIAAGCPYDCTYCFLQSYTNNPYYIIYVNLDDMLAELRASRGRIRLGTGEFTDSLALEQYTGFAAEYAPRICAVSPDITLELKTKSSFTPDKIWTAGLTRFRRQIVLAWSLNPQMIIDSEEHYTASLADRIQAARSAAAAGCRVALHFDPIIYSPGWQEQYQAVFALLNIPPEKIAWVSLGAFRFTPSLKPIIERRFPDSTIVYGELFPGRDRKMRYPEPIRIKVYQYMLKQLAAISPALPVYLCMESPEVWQKVYNKHPAQVKQLNELF